MTTQFDVLPAPAVGSAPAAVTPTAGITWWAARFGLLGDETRLRLLIVLHQAPGITVADLAAAVGISHNAASHSLAGLRTTGMIRHARDGKFRRWSIADPTILDLLAVIGETDCASCSLAAR